ncbi:MHF histone-fold complex component [Stylosanthes scabra]|uniref:MHF histone-fold complex component n=1 Tax=Stylosanthes scabra TaxID=79078 RepID=A0ABU6XJX1_9FABA|nr:MHF histone-fold complex component [Stylosanthes scabra]
MAPDRVALGSSSEIERGEEHEQQEQHDSEAKLLRDRFRLSAISIAESEASKSGMEVSKVVVSCVADLAFKFTEGLAKDLQLFARHANRKCVNMEDVILSAHRNEHVSSYLRTFSNDLKAKDPPSDRKRKKETKKNDKNTHLVHVSEGVDALEG